MRGSLKLLVLGATMATLSASGIFSLTNDVVDIGPNDIRSGEYSAGGGGGPAHDVAMARIAFSDPACPSDTSPGEAYDADDQIGGAFNADELGLTPGEFGEAVFQQDDFCIKNFGTEAVALTLAASSFVSKELGSCTASEQSAGDASCASGAAGEFQSPEITFTATMVEGQSSECGNVSFKSFDAPATITTFLEPGSVCRFYMQAASDPSFTDQARLLRQTDTIQFMLQLVASDGFLL